MTDVTPDTIETDQTALGHHKKQIVIGLAVAFAIMLLAWYMVGRTGVEDLGKSGINTSLLPKVGEKAPDFIAISPDGQVVKLSDFHGQPVWLNFWGSWCPPCRAEMPDIQTAWEQLEPTGLKLLAVSLGDKPSEAMNFAKLNGVTFDILLDPDRTLTGPAYPIYNFPTHIFVDKDGIVQQVVLSIMNTDQAIKTAETILSPEQTALIGTAQ